MSSTRKITHPALALFEKLFNEAVASESFVAPDHFVEASIFEARLTKEGIEHPSGFIAYADWCDEIGLPELAHKLITRHHRKHGSQRDPSREAAWRFHQRRKRENLAA